MEEDYENSKLRNYLLGDVKSEQERCEIEIRLITDDNYFQLFEIIEDDLIQEYIDRELTEDEYLKFNKNFILSNERIEKFKFAYLLRAYLNSLKK